MTTVFQILQKKRSETSEVNPPGGLRRGRRASRQGRKDEVFLMVRPKSDDSYTDSEKKMRGISEPKPPGGLRRGRRASRQGRKDDVFLMVRPKSDDSYTNSAKKIRGISEPKPPGGLRRGRRELGLARHCFTILKDCNYEFKHSTLGGWPD